MGWRDAPLVTPAAPARQAGPAAPPLLSSHAPAPAAGGWRSAPLEPAPSHAPNPERAYDNSRLSDSDFPPAPGDTQPYGIDALRETIRGVAPGLWATFHPGSPEALREHDANRRLGAGDPTALMDTNIGGLVMAPMASGARAVTTLRPPRIQTTPAAKTLAAQGVEGLTVGQRAPDSLLGVVERASADHPFGMGPQRTAVEESFQRVAQNKGVAPGAQIPKSNDLQGRLGELFEGFDQAYGPLKAKPVDPAAVAALPGAAKMPGRGVDARTAAGVEEEVRNALTVLGKDFGQVPGAAHAHGHGGAPKPAAPTLVDAFGRELPPTPPPPKSPPKATVGDIMKARENVRREIRSARQSPNGADRLRLLKGAEDVLTEGIESALEPAERAILQAADRQYARLMLSVEAAPAGQTNFTPGQYLRRVEKAAGRRNFKKGEAGDAQDLGEAARETFANLPMTGVRPGILSFAPGAKYWGAPIARLANSNAGKRFLLEPRQSTHIDLTPGAGDAINAARAGMGARGLTPEIEALLRAMGRPQIGLQPGAAEDRPR